MCEPFGCLLFVFAGDFNFSEVWAYYRYYSVSPFFADTINLPQISRKIYVSTSQLNYLTISENSHLRRLQAKKWGFFSLHPIMKKGMSRLQFIYLEIIAN